ncbi:MAG: hydrogenase iron-sulfur subunit [bacterium]
MRELKPEIVVFCCHNSIPKAVNLEEVQKRTNLKLIKMPCSGKVEVLYLLKALESGADGVLVAGCLDGICQSLEGNLRAKTRVSQAKKYLEEIGIGQERLQISQLDSSSQQALVEAVNRLVEQINDLGPNPLSKIC